MDITFDYHSHILPGCDHGSDGIETSLKQIEMAEGACIKTICATPHFYPHKESVEAFLSRRQRTYEALKERLPDNAPNILLGAEVLICDGMDQLDELDRLCRQGTNELLLELPFYRWPESVWETVDCLNDRDDIRIVIAHADRYPPEDIERLIGEGISLQLNVECFKNPLRRKRYISWIKKGYVKYLGSDIHMLGSVYRDWEKCRKLLVKNLG